MNVEKNTTKTKQSERKSDFMTSKKAQRYISRKIKILRKENYPEKQAVAIAYSMARAKGYKIKRVI